MPDGLSLEKLSEIRASFIIERDWGHPEDIKRHFMERDNTLKSFEKYEKVILWFEHDLYDQLQLLQILDWFYQNKSKETALSIICVNQYLGMLSPDEMEALFKYEEPVTENLLLRKMYRKGYRDGWDRAQPGKESQTIPGPAPKEQ